MPLMGITIVEEGFAGISKRAANEIRKQTLAELGEKWHGDYRNKHFTPAGASEYGYKKRKKAYNRIKKRIFGHTNPLEFTGRSREASRHHRVASTRHDVRVIMPGVRAFNFKNRHSNINMREEFTTVSDRERTKLETFTQRRLVRRLNRVPIRRKKRIA